MTIREQQPSGEFPLREPVHWKEKGGFMAQWDGPRIGRDQLYMSIAQLFSARSTCRRGQVGCVAVRANHIVAAGYNGAPRGMAHCIDVGCGGGVLVDASQEANEKGHYEFPNGCTRAIHAEQNMVAFAARHGIPLEGCTVYATNGPCLPCGQALVASGIAKLVYETPYRLPQGLELVDKANIPIERYYYDHD